MKWVSFQKQRPEDKHQLITRKICSSNKGDILEEWPEWISCCQNDSHTHWWDGDFNITLATVYWSLLYRKEN